MCECPRDGCGALRDLRAEVQALALAQAQAERELKGKIGALWGVLMRVRKGNPAGEDPGRRRPGPGKKETDLVWR